VPAAAVAANATAAKFGCGGSPAGDDCDLQLVSLTSERASERERERERERETTHNIKTTTQTQTTNKTM
jgi:hypothetical protein